MARDPQFWRTQKGERYEVIPQPRRNYVALINSIAIIVLGIVFMIHVLKHDG